MYEQIVRALAEAKIRNERELQRVINEHRRELQVRPLIPERSSLDRCISRGAAR